MGGGGKAVADPGGRGFGIISLNVPTDLPFRGP